MLLDSLSHSAKDSERNRPISADEEERNERDLRQ